MSDSSTAASWLLVPENDLSSATACGAAVGAAGATARALDCTGRRRREPDRALGQRPYRHARPAAGAQRLGARVADELVAGAERREPHLGDALGRLRLPSAAAAGASSVSTSATVTGVRSRIARR